MEYRRNNRQDDNVNKQSENIMIYGKEDNKFIGRIETKISKATNREPSHKIF